MKKIHKIGKSDIKKPLTKQDIINFLEEEINNAENEIEELEARKNGLDDAIETIENLSI